MKDLNLDPIFKKRFHGAVNIRGIDFQILYALYEGLLLVAEDRIHDSVTLEGIEDVDLQPFQSSGTFIQVKTADTAWHWAELTKVIAGFAEVLTVSPNSRFRLVVNFSLNQRLSGLAGFVQQSAGVQKSIVKEVEKLCRKANVNPAFAQPLINNLSITSITKAELLQRIERVLISSFDLHPEAVETYVLSFAYQFLDWAIDRKTVTALDIRSLHVRLAEGLARGQQFEAYGKYLIDKIDWSQDRQPTDYLAGKRTRPGHIALGLDVERPDWLRKIDLALAKKPICIIKAASGEGKSTLGYRYAYQYWLPEYTYVVRSARTIAEAQQIIAHLSGLAQVNLPVTVLLEDVQEEIRYYSEIIAGCAANGIRVLVTIRNEDYERFTSWHLTDYEIITPGFELAEAKAIYRNLKSENRIHKDAPSAEAAFEQIGSSATLIEYIYFVTQGQMLAERLRQQVAVMGQAGEGVKVELLRQLMVAHACRVPVRLDRMATTPAYASLDIQRQLTELTGEYINLEANYIVGYHWVRSNHLVRLLHEQYVNVAITGLKVLDYLEEQYVPTFIENILALEDADQKTLINGLADKVGERKLKYILTCINGLFRGGERRFFIQNQALFDQAYRIGHQGGIFMLSTSVLPTTQLNLMDSLKIGPFKQLSEIRQQIVDINRGFHLVASFLEKVDEHITAQLIAQSPELLGDLLDWLFWCKLKLPVVDTALEERTLTIMSPLNLPIEELCLFSQSFYRYNPKRHARWFNDNRRSIIRKLEEALDCKVSISGSELNMTYRALADDAQSMNDATMYRLDRLRSAIPFCSLYEGNNAYASLATTLVKFSYSFAHNDSHKKVSADNLHFRSDVDKNRIIHSIIDDNYKVKTWYEFLEAYYIVRTRVLSWVEYTIGVVNNTIKSNTADPRKEIDVDDLKGLPDKSPQADFDEELEQLFKRCRNCFNDFHNVIVHLTTALRNPYDEQAKRLLFLNYNNFLINLPGMQAFFDRVTELTPDYFDFTVFADKENKLYPQFKQVLKNRILNSEHYWELSSANLIPA